MTAPLWKRLLGLDNESDPLVNVLRAAQEYPEVRVTLLSILDQDAFQRRSMLGTLTGQLTIQNAPADLIKALTALRDDELANQALKLLRQQPPGSR